MTLDAETRTRLRQAIDERQRRVECVACGNVIPTTDHRRRYCNKTCSNRHWHVRRRELAAELRKALPLLEQAVLFQPDTVKEPAMRVVELAEALLANESLRGRTTA